MHEFEFPNDTPIVLSGQIRIDLPEYMTELPEPAMIEVKKSPVKNKWRLFIAVGFDKKSGDIVAISADGRFYELNAEKNGLPQEKCIPIDNGLTIQFPDSPGLIEGESYEVATDWFVSHARVLPVNIDLFG